MRQSTSYYIATVHQSITSAQEVNSYLACYPTIQQPGFDLPRQQWSLLNRFRTEQGHCGACRRKWRLTDTDLCPCGEIQTMSHIVESCPMTKLNGGLSRLHSADEDAVSWLTNCGSWHAYEKNKTKKWLSAKLQKKHFNLNMAMHHTRVHVCPTQAQAACLSIFLSVHHTLVLSPNQWS